MPARTITARRGWLVAGHAAVLWHAIAFGLIPFGLFALLLYWTAIYQRHRSGAHEAAACCSPSGRCAFRFQSGFCPGSCFESFAPAGRDRAHSPRISYPAQCLARNSNIILIFSWVTNCGPP